MKKIIVCSLIALFAQAANATILLVDNNQPNPQVFSTIQAAIDSALATDTIYIKASATNYGPGNITIGKSLSLIGEGYNDDLGLLTTNMSGSIQIYASDVYISGIKITGSIRLLDASGPGGSVISNILIERCMLKSIILTDIQSAGTVQNIRFRNNVFIAGNCSRENNFGNAQLTIDSLIFENNIFDNCGFGGRWNYITGIETVILRNNILTRGPATDSPNPNYQTLFYNGFYGVLGIYAGLNNAILYNNIFVGTRPQSCNNCTFYNNLTFNSTSNGNDTLVIPFNNNIYSQDPLFVSFSTVFSFSNDYHLLQSPVPSPCIGTGANGDNMGIYGGYFPFDVGAGPKIPVVDYVNISGTAVPQNSTFYLQFDAKARK